MWAILIELGVPALLVFALWRIWPKDSAPDAAPAAGKDSLTETDHDQSAR